MRIRPAVKIVFAPLARRGRQANASERQLRFLHGEAQTRTIWLDPRLSEVGKTMLHELLHIQHPGWEEERVRAEEELRWAKMSWKQKANLYRMLGTAVLEGDE
jgi:hypothetical protein